MVISGIVVVVAAYPYLGKRPRGLEPSNESAQGRLVHPEGPPPPSLGSSKDCTRKSLSTPPASFTGQLHSPGWRCPLWLKCSGRQSWIAAAYSGPLSLRKMMVLVVGEGRVPQGTYTASRSRFRAWPESKPSASHLTSATVLCAGSAPHKISLNLIIAPRERLLCTPPSPSVPPKLHSLAPHQCQEVRVAALIQTKV